MEVKIPNPPKTRVRSAPRPPETVRAIIAIQTDPGVKIILLEPQSLKFIGY